MSHNKRFEVRRRSSPASLTGGSLLGREPFADITYTNSFHGTHNNRRRSSPSNGQRRRCTASQQSPSRSKTWQPGYSTLPSSFTTFRQGQTVLSSLGELSETDDSVLSSPSSDRSYQAGRSFYEPMDVSETQRHNSNNFGGYCESSDHGSELLDKFSDTFRIGNRVLKGCAASPSSGARTSRSTGGSSSSEDFCAEDDERNLLECAKTLVELKRTISAKQEPHIPVQSISSRMRRIARHSKSFPGDSRDHRHKSWGPNSFRSSTGPSNETRSKTGCCEHLCRLLVTLVLVLVCVAAFGYILRQMMQSACRDNQQLNIKGLAKVLEERVYGQHIATSVIPRALQRHLMADTSAPLVMAFHGWTGIGKNFVSSLISWHVPRTSRHLVVIPLKYLPGENDEDHRHQVSAAIRNATRACTLNVFVLDDIDRASVPFVDGLHQVIKTLKSKPVSNSKTLILLLSNSGGSGINQYVLSHLQGGGARENVTQQQLEPIVVQALETAGDPSLHLYRAGLVDHIIPFLPLEAEHVKGCIRDYLRQNNSEVLTERKLHRLVGRVLEQLTFIPPDAPVFSNTGCRKVPVKVNLALGEGH